MEREVISILSKYVCLDMARLIHSTAYKYVKCEKCKKYIHEYNKTTHSTYISYYCSHYRNEEIYYFCSRLCKEQFDISLKRISRTYYRRRTIYYSGPNHKYDDHD